MGIKRNRIIYVIFSHSGTIPSKLIKLCTRYEYSHVSISLDEKPDEFYSFARKKFNPFIAGFVIESVDRGIFSKYINARCKVYEIEVTQKEYDKVKKVISRFKRKQEQYKYNYIGLISPMLHVPIKLSKRRFFCSQFVATALDQGRVINLPIDPVCIAPKILNTYMDNDEYATCVFEGKLREYPKVCI